MIQNNLLANRLNAFKKGEILPVHKNINENKSLVNNEASSSQETTQDYVFLNSIIRLSLFSFYSICFGYATKTLLNANWELISWLSVGFAIEILLVNITSIFSKDK